MTISVRGSVIYSSALGDDTSTNLDVQTGDAILCAIYGYHASSTITNVSVTGESAFSNGTFHRSVPDGNTFSQFWYLAAVAGASGTKSVRVQLSTTIGGLGQYALFALTGHDSADLFEAENFASGTGANASVNVSPATNNAALFSILVNSGSNATIPGGYTDIAFSNNAYSDDGAYLLDAGSAGSKSITYTNSSAAYHLNAVALNTTGGAASTILPPQRTSSRQFGFFPGR